MNTIANILSQPKSNSTVHVFARTGHITHFDRSSVIKLRDGSFTAPLCAHIMRDHSDHEFVRLLLPDRSVEVLGVLTEATVAGHQYSVQISRILPCLDEEVAGLPRSTPEGWSVGINSAEYKRQHSWRYRKAT